MKFLYISNFQYCTIIVYLCIFYQAITNKRKVVVHLCLDISYLIPPLWRLSVTCIPGSPGMCHVMCDVECEVMCYVACDDMGV